MEPNECLLLEDLSVRNFRIIDRYTEEVTADHVFLFTKTLGKFHAISFAINDQQPEKFNDLASKLKEMCIQTDNALLRDYFNRETEKIANVLVGEDDAKYQAKLKKVFEIDAIDMAAECLDIEKTGPASVITYGDAWQNNVMFQHDENGKAIGINLLDWQVARHSSPMVDLLYFLFCCTTKELRNVHYKDFLKSYHDSLSNHIKRYAVFFI